RARPDQVHRALTDFTRKRRARHADDPHAQQQKKKRMRVSDGEDAGRRRDRRFAAQNRDELRRHGAQNAGHPVQLIWRRRKTRKKKFNQSERRGHHDQRHPMTTPQMPHQDADHLYFSMKASSSRGGSIVTSEIDIDDNRETRAGIRSAATSSSTRFAATPV